MSINVDELREYLIDYYGSAIFSGLPMAVFDLSVIQNASQEELIRIAQKENIDLQKFIL